MNRKYQIDTEENRNFMKEMREDLLRFGHQFPSPGGSSYYLGDDGTPWKECNRETWITSRMAHVYSIGALLGHEGSGELVDAALRGLVGELHDERNGGFYAGVTSAGEILPGKQCYAHAFVILAASSALLAGREGAGKLLEEALSVFERRFWDEEKGLSRDSWNTEFTLLDEYRGINANMHTVEAFLAVADAAGREEYRARAGRIIDHVLDWASGNQWRIPEHFTKDWEICLDYNKECPAHRFKPYGATPGHGIEWARLILQWTLSTCAADRRNTGTGDGQRAETCRKTKDGQRAESCIEAAENLYDRAIADAWNVDGAPGIVYTTDWEGRPVIHDRMHWTLAEAINTSAVLYRVTKKERYASDYAVFLQYLDEKVLDRVNGSWFHQMDAGNRVIGTVWPGKSDIYHALQATLIPYHAPELSVAAAVKEGRKA